MMEYGDAVKYDNLLLQNIVLPFRVLLVSTRLLRTFSGT